MTDPTDNTPAFTFVDVAGDLLRFDRFRYEYPASKDQDDADWLDCRITFHSIMRQKIDASIITSELPPLAESVRLVLDKVQNEAEWEPLEPWINLNLSRESSLISINARIAMRLGSGPFIEYTFECREDEVRLTLSDIEAVIGAFPEHKHAPHP